MAMLSAPPGRARASGGKHDCAWGQKRFVSGRLRYRTRRITLRQLKSVAYTPRLEGLWRSKKES